MKKKKSKKLRRILLVLLLLIALPFVLFAVNGLFLSPGNTPVLATSDADERLLPAGESPRRVKVLAYNIAKAFAYKHGFHFEDEAVVRKLLADMGALIRAEDPDIVFVSELLKECGPCPVDQLAVLAKAAGFRYTAYGENYSFGFPLFKVAGGNAILAKMPLVAVDNFDLEGRQPFWVTKNNRRVLFCSAEIAGETVLLGAVHTDSFSGLNNLAQTRQILEWVGERPAILGGDFNANPGEPSIETIRDSGRFSGEIDGELSFPAKAPEQKLDFIFAPADWKLIEHRVIDSQLSDHRPVVSIFEVSR